MKRRVFPIIALAFVPSLALASDPPKGGTDPAAAQSLFYDARTLMQQNRFNEACPKLEESLRLDPGIGTQFNLAECDERLGRITSAWALYLEVASEAKALGQPDRERLARKRAAALEPRLPKLVIDVSSGAPQGLEVKRDGVAIGAAAWGTDIPVDPGVHRVVVSAPGKQSWETSVTAVEGKAVHVAAPRDLQAVIASAVAPPSPPPAAEPAPAASALSAASFPPPIVENVGATQRTLGWIVTGVGAAGIGVGAGFGLSSIGKRNESRSHCTVDQCDATGVGLRDDAMRAGNVATIATIAGGAAVLGGLLLVLTAPRSTGAKERAGKLHAVPNVAMGGGGITLQGVFR